MNVIDTGNSKPQTRVGGLDVSRVAAPMVGQSDLPFRRLVLSHGATTAFTQMLSAETLLNDRSYCETWLQDLMPADEDLRSKTVVQLSGNDPDHIVGAARIVSRYCGGIDLNLGCPQEHAAAGHYGGYLLGKRDWPTIETIISALAKSSSVPVSAKIRLCNPSELTPDLAQRIAHAGAAYVTLHARTVSAKRRRAGAADLAMVRAVKEKLSQDPSFSSIPVISNGNVRAYGDLAANLEETGADGLMVGEALLDNPLIFEGSARDPVEVSLEYLKSCKEYDGCTPMKTIQTHIRHIVDAQFGRRPWFKKFRSDLGETENIDQIMNLLQVKVQRWRGKRSDGSSGIEPEA